MMAFITWNTNFLAGAPSLIANKTENIMWSPEQFLIKIHILELEFAIIFVIHSTIHET